MDKGGEIYRDYCVCSKVDFCATTILLSTTCTKYTAAEALSAGVRVHTHKAIQTVGRAPLERRLPVYYISGLRTVQMYMICMYILYYSRKASPIFLFLPTVEG